jgi:hypothetical protein
MNGNKRKRITTTKLKQIFKDTPGIRVLSRDEVRKLREAERKQVEKYGRWSVETERHLFEADGRTFELFVVDDGQGSIFEHGSDLPPMEFDDLVELWSMWVDLKESFNVPLTEEEKETVDALEIPRPDEE